MPASPSTVSPATVKRARRRRRVARHSSGKVDKMGFLKGNSVRRQKRSNANSAVRRLSFGSTRKAKKRSRA